MKKTTFLLLIFFLTGIMQAQDRTQPKPGKSPVVNIKKPKTFTLPNGLKVMVVEDHKLPRVTYNLTLDNPPFAENNKKGVDNLTSNLIGNGSTKISKDDLNEEIDFLGANINFSSSGASANALSKYADRILELLSYGALYPDFTQVEFEKEKAKLLENFKAQEKSVPAIATRVVDVLAFGKSHPFGEYSTEESINNVTLTDVKNNYKTYFSPQNAYLVIIGDINFDKIKVTVEKLFGSWEKRELPKTTYPDPVNVPFTQINFVDAPNAVQSEIAIVNTLYSKMNAPDFLAVVIATQILGGDYNSFLNMNIRETHGWAYGAGNDIGISKYITKIKSYSSVTSSATDSAVVEFVKEIKRIRTEKVSEQLLKDVKAGFIGRFVMRVEKPQSVARYALNIETDELPKDFYENYIKSINAVTADDVLKAANKVLLIDNSRIIIVGKGEEVLPGLEKLNLPIFYFDKFGNPTEKPKY